MKVFIIGGAGMLGHKLIQGLQAGFEVSTTIRKNKDFYGKFRIFDSVKTFEYVEAADIKKIEEIVEKIKPDVIVNAVGIVKQLSESKSIVSALQINSIFPHLLYEAARKYNARLITISTDCVFSGNKGNYNEENAPDADDLYGISKRLGEVTGIDCLTLRTSIIGRELLTRHGLVEWFLSNDGGTVKGFRKAFFSGFPTVVLAEIIGDLIENHKNLAGLYHLSSESIDKFTLLNLIKRAYKLNIEIEPEENFHIDRSLDSSKLRKITGFDAQSWERMIDLMAADPTRY